MELREIIPSLNRDVIYNGKTYTMKESIVWKDAQGNINYSAILIDPNCNSQYRVGIKDIRKTED